jgi:hypothetical protein
MHQLFKTSTLDKLRIKGQASKAHGLAFDCSEPLFEEG